MNFFYADKEIIACVNQNLRKETGTVIFVCGSICRGHCRSEIERKIIKFKFKVEETHRWINDG